MHTVAAIVVTLTAAFSSSPLVALIPPDSEDRAVPVPDVPSFVNEYELVWHDEFNGNALDESKWDVPECKRRDAWWSRKAVSLDGKGNLVISTLREGDKFYDACVRTKGKFELEPPNDREFDQPLDASVQEILMEGFRQKDELDQLRDKLPPMQSRIILRTPLEAPLHELEPSHLDILQQSLNSPNLAAVFERSKATDLEIATIILELIKRGYLTSVGG